MTPLPSAPRTAVAAILALAAFGCDGAEETVRSAPVAKALPAFDLTDIKGKKWTGADFKGKVVLVEFWASYCPPCVEMMPLVERLHSIYKGKKVAVLSVGTDKDKGAFDRFVAKHPATYRVFHDAAGTYKAWGVESLPHLVLVKDGRIAATWKGKVDALELNASIKDALGGPGAD